MTVAEYIEAKATTPEMKRFLRKQFKAVLQEPFTALGNDTLLAESLGVTWQEVKEFSKQHKPKK